MEIKNVKGKFLLVNEKIIRKIRLLEKLLWLELNKLNKNRKVKKGIFYCKENRRQAEQTREVNGDQSRPGLNREKRRNCIFF